MMVLDFYKLREPPFGVTPDSRFLYMSATHREALASLVYGLESGCGFVALIAEPGLGKTTLLFHALIFLRDKVTTIFLSQRAYTPAGLLRAVLAGLGVNDAGPGSARMQSRLKDLLTEQHRVGKRVVVVIDEAQNLDDEVLESVRMLSNFETDREKLIQIILCGQPQLAEKIALPRLVQLRQRISIFARLDPFSVEDIDRYIDHRLRTAGYDQESPLFDEGARALIAHHSEGVPRNINNLCFNALSIGCALKRATIDEEMIREVVGDLDLGRWQKQDGIAVGSAALALRPTPHIGAAATAPAEFGAWLSALAAVVAVLLVLTGVFVGSHNWRAASGPVLANRSKTATMTDASPTASKVTPTSTSSAETSQINDGAPLVVSEAIPASVRPLKIDDYGSAVRVLPGRTILGICRENYGTCDSRRLQEIHRLNPRLRNLNHIRAGERLRLPTEQNLSQNSNTERSSNTPHVEDNER